MATGINVSKTTEYGAIGPAKGQDIAKTIAYAVLAPAVIYTGIDIAKSVAYVVLKKAGDFMPALLLLARPNSGTGRVP